MSDFIAINGKMIPADDAAISPFDRGLLLGDGLFETMRAYHGHVLYFDRHWERLIHSALQSAISIPLSKQAVIDLMDALLKKNQLAHHDAIIRLTLTRGVSVTRGILPMDLQQPPTLLIYSFPYQPVNKAAMSVHISTVTVRNEYSPLSRLKTLNYLDHILARLDAQKLGADEAILLNTRGFIASATTANVFAIMDACVITPPVSDGVLPGIMRRNVIDLCHAHQIPIMEKSIHPDEWMMAEELFLTNSVMEIMPICAVNGKTIPVGKITHALRDALALEQKRGSCKFCIL